jgi:hypothetical protein
MTNYSINSKFYTILLSTMLKNNSLKSELINMTYKGPVLEYN